MDALIQYPGGVDEQYFSDSAPASEDDLRTLRFTSRGHDLDMRVSDRVFSGSRLDLGTAQLLALAPLLPTEGTFVDVGCGWGPIAVTMGLESPNAQVWAVDVNSRALDLARRNAALNEASNVEVLDAATALERAHTQGQRFDVIWSNPPVRIGKQALHTLLSDWLSLLSVQGVAYLVVQKNLGADSLTVWLRDQGWDAVKIASKKGFRIIEVSAASSSALTSA